MRTLAQEEDRRQERETRLVASDPEAMHEVLADYLGQIPWPHPTEIDFDLGDNHRTLAIDIQLASANDMPGSEWTMLPSTLRAKRKPLSPTRRRELYRDYTHAVAFRVIGEAFHRLPALQRILVSAYTSGTDPATGTERDDYLYSVIVDRSQWGRIDFSALDRVDPIAALANFQIRRSMTTTGVFRPVEPFAPEDLEQLD